MLPDLPKLKNGLFGFQQEFLHRYIKQGLGPFEDCKRIPMYEGHRHSVQRPTGDEETHNFTPIGGEISLKPHEDDLDITFKKLYDTAEQMGMALQKKTLDQLDKSLEATGQSVNAEGMSAVDAIFGMFEKVEFPLGPDGKLDMSGYKLLGGTIAYEPMMKAWKEIQTDPEKIKKMEELLKSKEKSARAKEANRKLVG
jgi:hypothetical protein